MKPTILEHFKGVLFHVFPHHPVSRLMHAITRIRSPLAQWAMRAYIRFFNVDMSDAATEDLADYACFNDFFTRALKADARPICFDADAIVSPCDGAVSECGDIDDGRLYQVKGQSYTVAELLGDAKLAKCFTNGTSCTIYLSPADYHRVHLPMAGTLRMMKYVPGRLFSVARYARSVIPRLFTRNERVISLFETEHGLLAIVMVGAVNVGCISTVWDGVVAPGRLRHMTTTYTGAPSPVQLARGDEMGCFHMGSTVVVLFESGDLQWDDKMAIDGRVRVGEVIARVRQANDD